jgi:hypothetical protein
MLHNGIYSMFSFIVNSVLQLLGKLTTIIIVALYLDEMFLGNSCVRIKQEVPARTNRLLSLIRHGPH